MTGTQWIFLIIVGLLIIQRLAEMIYSGRNEKAIQARGGYEASGEHFIYMKALHSLWFLAMLAEVYFLSRVFYPPLFIGALAALCLGQILRYAAIRTLGERWTVKIMILPDAPAVVGGIFRYIRHPNYLGVIIEIAAVPLLHTAWLTTLVFSLLNGLLLIVRIRAEEKALSTAGGSTYEPAFEKTPRFIPRAPGTR